MKIRRTVVPIKSQHRQAGDNRRQRKQQIDHRIDQPFADDIVTHQHLGNQQNEHNVDYRNPSGDGQHHPQRVHRGVRCDYQTGRVASGQRPATQWQPGAAAARSSKATTIAAPIRSDTMVPNRRNEQVSINEPSSGGLHIDLGDAAGVLVE